jgi:hypothetical protein
MATGQEPPLVRIQRHTCSGVMGRERTVTPKEHSAAL